MTLRRVILATPTQIIITKTLIHIVCLGYAGIMLYLGWMDRLGGDPVQALLHFTGISAIHLLFITLSLSPIAKLARLGSLIKLRRLLGIYSFVFALSHLLVYVLFELQLNLALIWSEITGRPYIIVGMVVLCVLLLLTLTSPKPVQRWLGKRWQPLHRLVYLALPLALLHYLWAQKTLWNDAWFYWLALILLFAIKYAVARSGSLRRAKHHRS